MIVLLQCVFSRCGQRQVVGMQSHPLNSNLKGIAFVDSGKRFSELVKICHIDIIL